MTPDCPFLLSVKFERCKPRRYSHHGIYRAPASAGVAADCYRLTRDKSAAYKRRADFCNLACDCAFSLILSVICAASISRSVGHPLAAYGLFNLEANLAQHGAILASSTSTVRFQDNGFDGALVHVRVQNEVNARVSGARSMSWQLKFRDHHNDVNLQDIRSWLM